MDSLTSHYKWSLEEKENFKKAFSHPNIVPLINVCKQKIEAGIIESTGLDIQNIFQKAAELSLTKSIPIKT